jgi:hypothetical protein
MSNFLSARIKRNFPVRRLLVSSLILIGGLLAGRASAATITVKLDLDSLSEGPLTATTLNGIFKIAPWSQVSSEPAYIVSVNGTKTIQDKILGWTGADTLIYRPDGGRFSLVSMEIAALNGDGDTKKFDIWVSSIASDPFNIVDAYSIVRDHSRNFSFYGTGTALASTFTLFTFSGWTNLKALDIDPVAGPHSWEDAGFAVRNIMLSYDSSSVPEIDALSGTGALTLLAGALTLAGERRRRA